MINANFIIQSKSIKKKKDNLSFFNGKYSTIVGQICTWELYLENLLLEKNQLARN